MYCKYVSATHTISLGPRQYCAGVTWFDRYSDRISLIRGRSSNLPSNVTYLNSRVSDRRRARDVFPNISNACGRSSFGIRRTVIAGTNKNQKILNYICSAKRPRDSSFVIEKMKTKLLLSFFYNFCYLHSKPACQQSCCFKPAATHQTI